MITVLQILIVIVAVALIVSVMMQNSDSDGVSALVGGSETFFGKNQKNSLEVKLAMTTKISAGLFVVLAIVIMLVSK